MNELRPVLFGEILFDHFPDGEAIPGGAPFNVAWHLAGFRLDPLLVSAVGDDPEGARFLDLMDRWGLDTSAIQRLGGKGTGKVDVTLSGDEAHYEIGPRQAFDFIGREEALAALATLEEAGGGGLLYHGTLALRHRPSADTLQALRGKLGPGMVDLNLRAPWWDESLVGEVVQGARWLKMNLDEARVLLDRPVPWEPSAETGPPLDHFCQQHNLQAVVITMGAQGAIVHQAAVPWPPPVNGAMQAPPPAPRTALVQVPAVQTFDPVGAGDAFSAVLLVGILEGWDLEVAAERAAAFAADYCTIPGATAERRELYEKHMESWRTEANG